ncbi:hypothetical protein HZH68_006277 [Vespula germanica]|uniref:Uncharacterized protein n=1 Tax=Vespula germanica TaxID=30212 RepID=A0A834KB85_VESGE|nr:hypothetical protein HZH68_006277 [Vespula germanica]
MVTNDSDGGDGGGGGGDDDDDGSDGDGNSGSSDAIAVADDGVTGRYRRRTSRSLSLIRWCTLDKDILGAGSFPSKSNREMGKEKGQSFSSVIQFNSSSSNSGSSGDDGTSTRRNTSRHHRRVSL